MEECGHGLSVQRFDFLADQRKERKQAILDLLPEEQREPGCITVEKSAAGPSSTERADDNSGEQIMDVDQDESEDDSDSTAHS